METIIDSGLLNFVRKNLSEKTQIFILDDLFENEDFSNKFLNECVPLKESDVKIGVAYIQEFQLFVINDSLSKRIKGTRTRIQNMGADDLEDYDMRILLKKRTSRLEELYSDYKITFERIHLILEFKYEKELKKIFRANSKLIPHRYSWSKYQDYSGYIFELKNDKTITITTKYAMGGD